MSATTVEVVLAEPVTVTVTDEPVVVNVAPVAVNVDVLPQPPVEVVVTPENFEVTVDLAGVPGPRGPTGAEFTATAGANLAPNVVVYLGTDAKAYPASNANANDAARAIGLTKFAALATETVTVVTGGPLVLNGAAAVGPLYLSTDGSPTSNPDTGVVELFVGYAHTASAATVHLGQPIYH